MTLAIVHTLTLHGSTLKDNVLVLWVYISYHVHAHITACWQGSPRASLHDDYGTTSSTPCSGMHLRRAHGLSPLPAARVSSLFASARSRKAHHRHPQLWAYFVNVVGLLGGYVRVWSYVVMSISYSVERAPGNKIHPPLRKMKTDYPLHQVQLLQLLIHKNISSQYLTKRTP